MGCGTPVLTSNVCSLPEVAGEAALLVDPASVDEIAQAIHRLATDDVLVSRLIGLGLERARSFSWPEHARRTLEVYRRVYDSSRK
jgi:glycosyltransferase involved in cell wall biosynthesis